MEDMISRNDAYNTLTEYYHHTTEIQHKALREALERVPDSQPELIEREAYIRGFEQGKTQGRLDTLSAQPEPCEDTISRQAVLDALQKHFNPTGAELSPDLASVLAGVGVVINTMSPSPSRPHDISKAKFSCPICGAEMEITVDEWDEGGAE